MGAFVGLSRNGSLSIRKVDSISAAFISADHSGSERYRSEVRILEDTGEKYWRLNQGRWEAYSIQAADATVEEMVSQLGIAPRFQMSEPRTPPVVRTEIPQFVTDDRGPSIGEAIGLQMAERLREFGDSLESAPRVVDLRIHSIQRARKQPKERT